jgi:hypothetical protein
LRLQFAACKLAARDAGDALRHRQERLYTIVVACDNRMALTDGFAPNAPSGF